MGKTHDLTVGSPANHLIRMTLPMTWGLFSILAINLVDTFFVGQLGSSQLAAMGFMFPIFAILRSLAFGIGGGAISVIARCMGAKKLTDVSVFCSHAILLSVITAVVFSIATYLIAPTFFPMLGASDAVMPYIYEYLDIWLLGSVVTVLPMVGNSCMRASGNTMTPSIIMTVVAVVNAILDPILIFGWGPVPEMGMAGAALATVIAYFFATLASLYVLAVKLKWISFVAMGTRFVATWRSILHVGLPSTMTNLLTPLSATITTWLIARYGSEAVAGFGVATRIETFSLVFVVAMTSVIGPFVGQNWGGEQYQRVKAGIRFAIQFAFAWGVGLFVFFYLFAGVIIQFFSEDAMIIETAQNYLVLVSITYGFLGVCMLMGNTANAIRKPMFSLLLTGSRLVILFLPLAFGLGYLMGLQGIFIATALTNTLVAFMGFYWYQQQVVCRAVGQAI